MASLDFVSQEPEKVLEFLFNLGDDGVEWTFFHFNPKGKSTEQSRKPVKLTGSYNLKISEVVVQQDVINLNERMKKDRIELVRECIGAATNY